MAKVGLGLGLSKGSSVVSAPPYENDYSLDFDGVNHVDYVNVGTGLALNGVSSFSFSCWCYLDQSALAYMFSHFDGGHLNDVSFASSWGDLVVTVDDGVNTSSYANAAGGVAINTWQHCACVYDGSGATNADKIKVYLNGAERTCTFAGTIPTTTASGISGEPVYLARGDGGYWKGKLDEIAFFESALSESQIGEIYNEGLPNDLLSSPNVPDGYWTFNDGSTANDTSGNGHHGIITNAVHSTFVPS